MQLALVEARKARKAYSKMLPPSSLPDRFLPRSAPGLRDTFRLPGELVDLVIDHLKSEPRALITCSQVSKVWVPRSRLYRFRTVSFHLDDTDLQKFLPQVQKVNDFLALAKSPLATFTAAVQQVSLVHRVGDPMYVGLSTSPDAIFGALQRCRIRPKCLSIDCSPRFFPSLPSPPSVAPLTASVVDLHLVLRDNPVARNTVLAYVCAFPRLKSLKIRGDFEHQAQPDDGPPPALTWPPNLRALELDGTAFTNYLRHITTPHITDLVLVKVEGPLPWSELNVFLRRPAAQHITTLTLTDCRLPAQASTPSLPKLPRLRHFTLSFIALRNIGFTLIRDILERTVLPEGTLETITIVCASYPSNPQGWLQLDEHLASGVWPRLRCVTLRSIETQTPAKMAEAAARAEVLAMRSGNEPIPLAVEIRRHFPHCVKRRLLVLDIPIPRSYV
ncbi:hypothetical protein C8R46DRAFT_1108339 [Mycena filopes]|nr:hypothetical protein C8R46DRAFT_1108339 [Mycena filopes]